jgi:hypothetical protein
MDNAAVNSAAVTEIRAFGPLTVAGLTVPRRRERTLLALLVAAAARRATGAPAGERVARCDEALGWWTGTRTRTAPTPA